MHSSLTRENKMNRKELNHFEKGQSLVELALVLFFILLLLAGVVDLGRMMYEYLTMRDAAQEGAGYGSIFPNYCAEIENRVMQNLPDDNYDVSVLVGPSLSLCKDATPAIACENNEIRVKIHHDFSVTMPFLTMFTGPTVPMDVEIKDLIVRPACN